VTCAKPPQTLLIAQVRSRLSRARRVVAFTGSGPASVAGVPAFSPSGHTLGGRSSREIATPRPFFEDPCAVWDWYDAQRTPLAAVQPSAAHRALAALEKRIPVFTLVTENIDGLHRLAGCKNVLELRGNIWVVRCTRCGLRAVNREIPIANPPSCPICTGLVRPDIIWQGEHLPEELLVRSFEALSTCEVLLVVGTSSRCQPAASFVGVARKSGAYLVEIAPATAAGDAAIDAPLVGTVEDLLPQIVPEQVA